MLRLLGSVRLDDRVLVFERATYLLAILALHGTWVSRDELCLLLWSEDTDVEVARMRLRQLLYRTKKLGLGSDIETQVERLRYTGQSDVQRLQQAFLQRDFAGGLALYRGAFLEGAVPYEIPELVTWLDVERDRLRSEVRSATLELVKQNPKEAQIWLEQLLQLEPMDEELLLLSLKFPKLATRALDWHLAALKAIGLEPEAGLLERFALDTPLESSLILKIPKATSLFIGRQLELEQIASFWQQPENRLLSLLGLGGLGKTRLALEVAEHFAGRVVFVSLVGIEDAQLIPRVLLLQLGLTGDDQQTLLQALENESLLLVLDNLEQVLEVRHLIAKILTFCPKIKILCTSREALGLQAEQRLKLEGLPALAEDLPLAQQAAAQVFLAAARRLEPRYQLVDTDFLALSRIHSAVAGMPLGLELAAGWLRVMPLLEIAQAIEADRSVLQSDAPDVPERQRSFEALFNSSWRLLSPDEQTALCQLALLRGGFTFVLAAQVTGVLTPTLLRLVNKSLLKRSQGKFYLHELIRQHAQSYLSAEARLATLDRVSDGLLELAKEWSDKSYQQEQTRLITALEAQHDNLRMVIEDAFLRSPDRAAALVAYSWDFCTACSYDDQAMDWLARAMAIPAITTEVRGLLLIGFAYVAPKYQRFAEGYAAADEMTSLYSQNTLFLAIANRLRGNLAFYEQNLEQADWFYTLSCNALLDLDVERYACYSSELARIKFLRGDLSTAKVLLEQGIGLARQIDDQATLADALCILAEVQGNLGDFENQHQLLEQAQIYAFNVGNQTLLGKIWVTLAHNAMARGYHEQAGIFLKNGLQVFWERRFLDLAAKVLLEIALFYVVQDPEKALWLAGGIQAHWRKTQTQPGEQQRHILETIRAHSRMEATHYHPLEMQGERLSFDQLVKLALELGVETRVPC